MSKQIIFLIALLVTLLAFGYTTNRFIGFFRLTRKGFPVKRILTFLIIFSLLDDNS